MLPPHPYRYVRAFAGQLARLEHIERRVAYGNAKTLPPYSPTERMQNDVANNELARRIERLGHIERLVADWQTDGEVIYRVAVDACDEGEFGRTIEFSDIPSVVTYIEFEPSPLLLLANLAGSCIEGMYMREIVAEGRFAVELTAVFNERRWLTTDRCARADTIEIVSRVSVGIIPLAEDISLERAARSFNGEPLLLSGPVLSRAILLAGSFAATGMWRKSGKAFGWGSQSR